MKKYQSKVDYSKKYNSKLSSFQVSKEIHQKVKKYCEENGLKVRDFLEGVIIGSLP